MQRESESQMGSDMGFAMEILMHGFIYTGWTGSDLIIAEARL